MTASKDDGSKPKDRPADKAAAPISESKTGEAKSGAAGNAPGAGSATATPAKPTDKAASSGGPATKPGSASGTGAPSGSGPVANSPAGAPGKPAAPTPDGATSAQGLGSGTTAPPASPVTPLAGKPASSSEPLKAGATGCSAVPPIPQSRDTGSPKPSEPAKVGATGSAAVKPSATVPPGGSAKDESKSASRVDGKDGIGDGPILDLKAKRVPDTPSSKTTGPSTDPVSAPPGAVSRGAGVGTIAASGLLGGVIGAGLLFALSQSGVLPADTSRLDAIDRTLASLATRDALGATDKRVAANEQALKPLAESVQAASSRADEALKKAASAPPAGSDQNTGQAAPPADLVARLDALDQRVSALQEEPGRDQPAGSAVSTPPAVEGPQFDTLRRDIDERAKADRALDEKVDRLQQSIDQRIQSSTDAIQAATEASRKAIDAGKSQVDEAKKSFERILQEQAERIAALGKTVDGSAKSTTVDAALRIVAADRIATALAAGVPYSDALTSLRGTKDGDAGVLAPLEPFAETGAPTASSLAAAFRPIRDKVLAAQRAAKARSVAESGSITDRLQTMASSIVQVRRVDEPGAKAGASATGGDDATLKVQDALEHGRIGAAAEAFAALPDDVRAQAGDFGAKLKARADADAAALSLQTQAFRTLSAGR